MGRTEKSRSEYSAVKRMPVKMGLAAALASQHICKKPASANSHVDALVSSSSSSSSPDAAAGASASVAPEAAQDWGPRGSLSNFNIFETVWLSLSVAD